MSQKHKANKIQGLMQSGKKIFPIEIKPITEEERERLRITSYSYLIP